MNSIPYSGSIRIRTAQPILSPYPTKLLFRSTRLPLMGLPKRLTCPGSQLFRRLLASPNWTWIFCLSRTFLLLVRWTDRTKNETFTGKRKCD
ncbi:hypothetical protein TNIN_213651 [Trichonephila inaurata madagascariensis]|uniref:Uncharacterized protein n=1 Tax=Trichonephila inaurata madagascariensis TaxID=2747483 RepID=A0A8X6WU77_9ARAC|nr:hypothetical protein TNIN_213651 [Trichonephila inaurata madagascariensis]